MYFYRLGVWAEILNLDPVENGLNRVERDSLDGKFCSSNEKILRDLSSCKLIIIGIYYYFYNFTNFSNFPLLVDFIRLI